MHRPDDLQGPVKDAIERRNPYDPSDRFVHWLDRRRSLTRCLYDAAERITRSQNEMLQN